MPKERGAHLRLIHSVNRVFTESSHPHPAVNEIEDVPDVSAHWYRAVTDLAADAPGWLRAPAPVATEAIILIFLGLFVLTWWRARAGGDRQLTAALLAPGRPRVSPWYRVTPGATSVRGQSRIGSGSAAPAAPAPGKVPARATASSPATAGRPTGLNIEFSLRPSRASAPAEDDSHASPRWITPEQAGNNYRSRAPARERARRDRAGSAAFQLSAAAQLLGVGRAELGAHSHVLTLGRPSTRTRAFWRPSLPSGPC